MWSLENHSNNLLYSPKYLEGSKHPTDWLVCSCASLLHHPLIEKKNLCLCHVSFAPQVVAPPKFRLNHHLITTSACTIFFQRPTSTVTCCMTALDDSAASITRLRWRKFRWHWWYQQRAWETLVPLSSVRDILNSELNAVASFGKRNHGQ